MPDPNFLIIGAQKGGTTWLASVLGQHPDVFVAQKKEVHFFNKRENYERGFDWYRQHFAAAGTAKAIGEATPNYLWTSEDPREIAESDRTRDIPQLVHDAYPQAKIIVSLRNPVDRAISAFYHHIRLGRVKPRARILSVADRFGIETMGHYSRHLTAWNRLFPLRDMLVLLFEESIRKERPATTARTYDFLGVDSSFKPPNTGAKNARRKGLVMTAFHYNKNLGRALQLMPLINRIDVPKIQVSDEERRELGRRFEGEIGQLEELLGRDLSVWKRS